MRKEEYLDDDPKPKRFFKENKDDTCPVCFGTRVIEMSVPISEDVYEVVCPYCNGSGRHHD